MEMVLQKDYDTMLLVSVLATFAVCWLDFKILYFVQPKTLYAFCSAFFKTFIVFLMWNIQTFSHVENSW